MVAAFLDTWHVLIERSFAASLLHGMYFSKSCHLFARFRDACFEVTESVTPHYRFGNPPHIPPHIPLRSPVEAPSVADSATVAKRATMAVPRDAGRTLRH